MNKSTIFILIVLSLGLVSASWYFIFGGNVTMNVYSLGSQKDATISFPEISVNTTEFGNTSTGGIIFAYNKAGTFRVEITETIADLSGGQCLNGSSDCTTNYTLNDGNSTRIILDGDHVIIPANSKVKTINSTISCVAYSCPQSRSTIIKLIQIS